MKAEFSSGLSKMRNSLPFITITFSAPAYPPKLVELADLYPATTFFLSAYSHRGR